MRFFSCHFLSLLQHDPILRGLKRKNCSNRASTGSLQHDPILRGLKLALATLTAVALAITT